LSSKFAEVFLENTTTAMQFSRYDGRWAHDVPRARARERAPEPALPCESVDPLVPLRARAAGRRRRGRTRERRTARARSLKTQQYGHRAPCGARVVHPPVVLPKKQGTLAWRRRSFQACPVHATRARGPGEHRRAGAAWRDCLRR